MAGMKNPDHLDKQKISILMYEDRWKLTEIYTEHIYSQYGAAEAQDLNQKLSVLLISNKLARKVLI